MKLGAAFLCLDDEEIFEARGHNPRCPSCGSRAYVPVSSFVPVMAMAGRENISGFRLPAPSPLPSPAAGEGEKVRGTINPGVTREERAGLAGTY